MVVYRVACYMFFRLQFSCIVCMKRGQILAINMTITSGHVDLNLVAIVQKLNILVNKIPQLVKVLVDGIFFEGPILSSNLTISQPFCVH